MATVSATEVRVEGDKLYLSTRFRRFIFDQNDVLSFRVKRIPSFFDEIGIELDCGRSFLITERLPGFFDVANFLRLDDLFGSLWYNNAESGRALEFRRHDI